MRKTGADTAIAVGVGDDDGVCEGVTVDDIDAVDVDEELAPRVIDGVGVFEVDGDSDSVVVGVIGGVDDEVGVRVPEGVAVDDVDRVELLESDIVGVCDALAAVDREGVGVVVIVVDPVTVEDGVFVGVAVPLGVFVPVGVPVCDREAVGVVESERDGVCDALEADDRDEVCEVVTVVEAEMVVEGVFGGVPVLDGVLVLVGV